MRKNKEIWDQNLFLVKQNCGLPAPVHLQLAKPLNTMDLPEQGEPDLCTSGPAWQTVGASLASLCACHPTELPVWVAGVSGQRKDQMRWTLVIRISPFLPPTGQGLSPSAWDLLLQLSSYQTLSSSFFPTFLLLLGRMAPANQQALVQLPDTLGGETALTVVCSSSASESLSSSATTERRHRGEEAPNAPKMPQPMGIKGPRLCVICKWVSLEYMIK